MSRIIIRQLLALSLATALFSSSAFASLILDVYGTGTATPDTIGGYGMTDFAVENTDGLTGNVGEVTKTVGSPLGGDLEFENKYGNDLYMTRNLADSTTWWNNGEGSDYDIFTTRAHWLTIILPENTRAFSFNVGADLSSTGSNAWLTATESDGNGIETKHWFNVSQANTPGFGIYADNDQGECSMVTSVTIEPDYWGVGNFSINQDPCSVSVPEPASGAIFGLGLVGLLLVRRNSRKH